MMTIEEIIAKLKNHERLVEALASVDWDKASNWGIVDVEDADKARTLLAALEAEKGGEL